ncbi:MAG: transglutaminase domain-containing protein, partial [Dethiobacteria bacterium]|nr:transglutaminase domain-containing protein [Dethiobacteria bacterium]
MVCVAVTALMASAGFYLLADSNETAVLSSSKVETAVVAEKAAVVSSFKSTAAQVEEDLEEKAAENKTDNSQPVAVKAAPVADNTFKTEEAVQPVAVQTAAVAPVDKKAESAATVDTSPQIEAVTEAPAAAPAVVEEAPKAVEQQVAVSAPVTYNWGASGNYTFRIEVKVTNNGSEASQNVMVSVPLLENSSPYQTTTLKSVNFDVVSTEGRVSTFNLGELAPGETKTITADFNINVRTVALNNSNETVEKARIAYDKHKGSGNCRVLAQAFIKEAQAMGLTAREVVGFARPQRGAMTSGSLQGSRHSWAEFYVDGLGWVPVDLTFQYFGTFPQTSHIVECYSDQSIKVNFTGGSLGASWSNSVL